MFQSDMINAMRLRRNKGPSPWRRVIVFFVGGLTLVIGLAMLALPGPAIIFIPLGLAILATEFRWARELLSLTRQLFRRRFQKSDRTKQRTKS
jgi:uncharacterized protein (TIGR02611 family)